MLRTTLATLFLSILLSAQGTGVSLTHGIDAHFDVPYSPLILPAGGLTLEAWITYDDSVIPTGTYHWPTVCRQNPTPQLESYMVRVSASNVNNRSLQFMVRTPAGTRSIFWAFNPGQLTALTHLACTWDGNLQVIYVNGVPVASAAPGGGRIVDNGGVLRVGNGDVSSPGAETWSGTIDELRIWPFARSQAEIADSMNDALSGMPGGVLTFGLDNDFLDSSAGLQGTPFGPIAFASNALTLTPRLPVVFSLGAGTSNCTAPVSAFGATAVIGRAFSWVATGAAPNAPGLLAIAFGGGTAINILGVNIVVDTSTLIPLAAFANALGTCQIGLSIPNSPALIGGGLASQFVFVDAACGPQGFVASDGLIVGIQ